MIPYAILRGKLIFETTNSVDITIFELGPNYFTFRLPKKYSDRIKIISSVEMSFFSYAEKIYKTIKLSAFSIHLQAREAYYDEYRTDTEDRAYSEAAIMLTKEYMTYIDAKLSLTDDEIAATFTDYPAGADELFFETKEEYIRYFGRLAENSLNISSWEFLKEQKTNVYYELQDGNQIDLFLSNDLQSFASVYFEKYLYITHPLSKCPVKGIIIGNSFCIHQLPDERLAEKLILTCTEKNIEVYITLPPTSETFLRSITKYVDRLVGVKGLTGIIANDMGMYDYIADNFPALNLFKGILLCKEYRDPRFKYLDKKSEHTNLCITDGFVYLPYYQTNTSTFCTLKAVVDEGARRFEARVTACDKACESCSFLYPVHLNMIGRFNSLFGFNHEALANGKNIKELLYNKKGLVINL